MLWTLCIPRSAQRLATGPGVRPMTRHVCSGLPASGINPFARWTPRLFGLSLLVALPLSSLAFLYASLISISSHGSGSENTIPTSCVQNLA